jgi:Na+-driven multidrug efflux pump
MGAFYPVLGLAFGLVFALQGAGIVLWPMLAGSARLAFVIAAAWLIVHRGLTPGALYGALAEAALVFALGMLAAGRSLLPRRRPRATADAPA